MDSYEDFCLRSLAALQEERKFKKTPCEPPWCLQVRSVIRFHGRAVLSPLLSAEQRNEMCELRRRAVQLEVERQNQQKNNLLARVQDRLEQVQAQKAPGEDIEKLPVSKLATLGGYTLVTDSPGLPRDSGFGLRTNDHSAPSCSLPPLLNGYQAVDEVMMRREEKSEEEEDEEEEDMSLDSLLKRSREFVRREQGSKVVHTVTRTPPHETGSKKDKRSRSPSRDSVVEFGFSLHHSPVGPPPSQNQNQTFSDLSPQRAGCLSPTLPERYARLPSPESSKCPRAQGRRPRPVSTGNIHISFPIGPADLIPRSPGRPEEGASVADWGHALFEATDSPNQWCSVGSDGGVGVSRFGNRRSSNCGAGPAQETSRPLSASGSSLRGNHDHLAAGFRRRCHTMDSQIPNHHPGVEQVDRSQERAPRFMAGVSWMARSWRTPAAASSDLSYEVDSPSPSPLRPLMTPDSTQVTLRREHADPRGTNSGRITPTVLRNAAEAQTNKTEEPRRRAHTPEDVQRHLEEHAAQMSRLLAEQAKEQHRLCLELDETERTLQGQGNVRPLSMDVCGWSCRTVSDNRPVMSPSCPGLSTAHTPSERSPGHSFPSPIHSSVPSPSLQPPVYLWGPTWAVSKPRARPNLFLTAEQQRAFCRLGAMVRGFLTRRLLKTEKVKHLRQTVMDTKEFIRSFQTEAPLKRGNYTAQDRSLQDRVRAQLRAAVYDIHDIFFEMPLGDRLALLQQDRELREERKLREMEKAKSPKDRVVLSAATQRSLDRKKRVGESPAQSRKMQPKPKSPNTNRVLKPSQGQNSPVPGQLNRQGSCYRKTPEDRVRRSESLKKQHSLG